MDYYRKTLELIQEYKKTELKHEYMDGFFTNPQIYIDRTKELLRLIRVEGDEIKVIHIAGTSAKGSTSWLIANSLCNAGNSVGLFTSPPMQSQTERFWLNGKYISAKSYFELASEVVELANTMSESDLGKPSVSEIYTVIFYVWCVRNEVGFAVVEAMAGGRFDATNALENKVATVLTRVGLDHMHLLGETTEKIAIDKARIARSGIKLFCGETDPKLQNLIRAICENEGAEYLSLEVKDSSNIAPLASVAVCGQLGVVAKVDSKQTRLPGRLEHLEYQGKSVLLDGAHNQQKMEYLMTYLQSLKYDRLLVVLGFSNNKNPKDFMKLIMSTSDELVLTSFDLNDEDKHTPKLGMRSLDQLENLAHDQGMKFKSYQDPVQAFQETMSTAKTNDLILVTGSMYLVGKIRNLFYPLEQVVDQQSSFPNSSKEL